jgi:hypothetical protein
VVLHIVYKLLERLDLAYVIPYLLVLPFQDVAHLCITLLLLYFIDLESLRLVLDDPVLLIADLLDLTDLVP